MTEQSRPLLISPQRCRSVWAVSCCRKVVNGFCYWLVTRVLDGQYTLVRPEPRNPYAPRPAFL